jgi:glycosyl transferase, family 25
MSTRLSQPATSQRNSITNATADIRLINLDRSTDRLATFRIANKHVMPHVTRFPAIEGKDVDRATLVQDGVIAPDLKYTTGAIGNALSHIALWDLAISEDRSLTICEDDAVFNHAFFAASESILWELPPDWHVVRWGWNFDTILWFDMIPGVSGCISWFEQNTLMKAIDLFQSAKLRPHSYRFYQGFGLACYSISPDGARSLRQHCLPLRNTSVYVPGLKINMANFALDVALNGIYSQVNSFVSFPPLVVTANDHSASTVQGQPE